MLGGIVCAALLYGELFQTLLHRLVTGDGGRLATRSAAGDRESGEVADGAKAVWVIYRGKTLKPQFTVAERGVSLERCKQLCAEHSSRAFAFRADFRGASGWSDSSGECRVHAGEEASRLHMALFNAVLVDAESGSDDGSSSAFVRGWFPLSCEPACTARGCVATDCEASYTAFLPKLKAGCGELCDLSGGSGTTQPGRYFNLTRKRFDCAALFANADIDREALQWPPPSRVPAALREDFTMGGSAALTEWWFAQRYQGAALRPTAVWTRALVEDYRSRARAGTLVGSYSAEETAALLAFARLHAAAHFAGKVRAAAGGHPLPLTQGLARHSR